MTTRTRTKASHTPGPWAATGLSGQWPDQTIGIKRLTPEIDGAEHATVNVLHRTEEARCTAEANARLIAAAPALLAALENLLREADDDGITRAGVDQAFAAIRAARNEET